MSGSTPSEATLATVVAAVLSRFGLSDAASATLINVAENWTYRVQDPTSEFVAALRVQRPGYHTGAEIESEIMWLDALHADGVIETARAVPALDGSRLLSLVADDGHVFHAVMFEWLAGVTPAESDLSRSFVQLGEITARMHRHVGTWTPPAGFVRFAWDYEGTLGPHGHWGRWQDGLGVGREELEQLSRLDARIRRDLERYGSGPDRYGLVHADARLANLLVDGDQIRVIDFDDCGWSWFMYDFASAVSFMETNPVVPELAAAWLEGYKRVRPVARADEEMLPTFVALRRLLLLAWIGSHYETASEAADLGAAFVVETCEFAESHLSGRALLRGV